MHFSTVALPAFAGVALAAQTPAAGTPTNASNTGKIHSGTASVVSNMPSATKVNDPLPSTEVTEPTTTTKLLTTTTCVPTPVVPTPDVTVVTEVIITEVIIAEATSTTMVPPASTTAVTTGTKTVIGSIKTVNGGTETIFSGTKTVIETPAPTTTMAAQTDMVMEVDKLSDGQAHFAYAVRVSSPVVTSAATRRLQVPGIFRLPVQLWKAVSGLLLQGAVVNAHGTPATVTATTTLTAPAQFPGTVTATAPKTVMATTAKTTETAFPSVVTQTWDDKNDNFPPLTVEVTVAGDRALSTPTSQEATTTVTASVTSTPIWSAPTTVYPSTTTSTTGVPTLTDIKHLPVATSGATRNEPPTIVSMAMKVLRYFN